MIEFSRIDISDMYAKLSQQRSNWQTEEDVRVGWVTVLQNALDIQFKFEHDRNDATYNQIVLEFKNIGLFNSSTTSPAFKEATKDRLKKYIQRKAKREGLSTEDYIGIAIDGNHLAMAYVDGNTISHGPLMPLSPHSIEMVVRTCLASSRRAVTADNLIEDFGQTSQAGASFMQSLADVLASNITSPDNNKIKMLFEEWRTLFGQVAGLSKLQRSAVEKNISFTVGVSSEDKIPALLFVIHTYNSLVSKLLAAEIVSIHGLTSFRHFATTIINEPKETLISYMEQDIERARLFSSAGILGFVEEAIFSWYIDACHDNTNGGRVVSSLQALLMNLSLYRTDNLTVARTSDVLKAFYHNLVPESLRKSLGEFYTPDWLVKTLIDRCGIKDWKNIRLLDPTCGSGSFLLEIIRRIRQQAEHEGWSAEDTLTLIVDSVWGFDLNPLAVQIARVNFLIAIADLLEKTRGKEIEIPVLLADAVYSPAPDPEAGQSLVEYHIGSSHANLKVLLPSELALNRQKLDLLFEVMGEHVQEEHVYSTTEEDFVQSAILTKEEAKKYRTALKTTYNRVLDLHKKNWNGIWFRIIRNFFWSATAGEFDLIVGNPPWVRWSNLPSAYREKIKPTCESYDIFSKTPHHGGNELDVSGMITYTVADKWLKPSGTLAFVITQTHFQSPSSSGFRLFNIDDSYRLVPQKVEDLKALKPFPDAANKTAMAFFSKERTEYIHYPIPYDLWLPKHGSPRVISTSSSQEEVMSRVDIFSWEATPVEEEGSPWAILPKGKFDELGNIRGASEWVQGRKGITTDLNGIYFVRILDVNESTGIVEIETRPEAGKHNIGPKRTFWIEADMLYPLLKGASDFNAFDLAIKDELYVLVPNTGIVKSAYESTRVELRKLRRTSSYFKSYQALLENRSTYKKRMPKAPYCSVYNVGDYTFAPYKVIWAEQSGVFKSAVASSGSVPIVGKRPYVPDHKIYFVDFRAEAPAHYLCGLLNSEIIGEYLYSHIISIQVGNVFKHLNIPPFDRNDPLHLGLSELSIAAHQESDPEEREFIIIELNNLANAILFP